MIVEFHNQTQTDITEIEKLITHIFDSIDEKKNMQIIFVTPEQIHNLNLTYRNVDRPTDVLSFPNDDEDDDSLGDIFISIEQAINQAEEYGHSFEREIGFLSVHGYLHLKGYDHHTPEEEKEMTFMQEQILKKAQLERVK
ncbi:Probable rRNA maturation factor [Alteracholeplasma palmae J233]|uniref:Endoribonuclease YbeY n=1 Tax=Alteracholeplasma palmae (strain ATCC 49389 / J233) TaxID=1318466 RepID=U4KRH1_ALTPJ|nr:rRNA maturation RNase YbeY [Alteracholeplasma palmae]CCV64161.1 Probable rRNA maturation factor [Alteracholeplasma palmae J233]